ncbi:MAG: NTP transferase domain-containing protein [Halobacteriovoraceae bacterium]|nr:NTP transferase domain-containing protein [Halobacteriovoraceae bacterium]
MISDFFIGPNVTIKTALAQLDKVKGLGLVVVDESTKLLGSLTDGDIRRALTLSNHDLQSSIEEIYHRDPIFVLKGVSENEKKEITKDKIIKIIPVLENDIVVDVFTVGHEDTKGISVVIMAGGLGSRLGEFTQKCPKPMLEVAGKPVLERILNNFTAVGFKNFFFSVNFMAEVIEDHFGDGSKFNCQVNYLKEDKRMGTAGSLSLLPDDIKGTIIVTNGDLLTLVDFRRLISFHNQHQSPITMCTRKYDFQVPFGVVSIVNGQAREIDEKPNQSFNISAGVYVIDTKLLRHVPKDEFFDMPTFLDKLIADNVEIHCFPLIEQWIDIGQVGDLTLAREKYSHD